MGEKFNVTDILVRIDVASPFEGEKTANVVCYSCKVCLTLDVRRDLQQRKISHAYYRALSFAGTFYLTSDLIKTDFSLFTTQNPIVCLILDVA